LYLDWFFGWGKDFVVMHIEIQPEEHPQQAE
jgi:hypothetical protein